jgi:hypothetical protein
MCELWAEIFMFGRKHEYYNFEIWGFSKITSKL